MHPGFTLTVTAYTADFTTVRLVSSIDTTPAAPEPTWAMLALGFAAMGWIGYRRSRAARAKGLAQAGC